MTEEIEQISKHGIYLSISDLLSLSMIISSCIHIIINGISFFLWLNNISLYICAISYISILLLMDI